MRLKGKTDMQGYLYFDLIGVKKRRDIEELGCARRLAKEHSQSQLAQRLCMQALQGEKVSQCTAVASRKQGHPGALSQAPLPGNHQIGIPRKAL